MSVPTTHHALLAKAKADQLLVQALVELGKHRPDAAAMIESLADATRVMARLTLLCSRQPKYSLEFMLSHYFSCAMEAYQAGVPVPAASQKERGHRTRRRILLAVVEAVEASKTDLMSMRGLRRLAKCGDGTVEVHFGNYPNLVVLAYKHLLERDR